MCISLTEADAIHILMQSQRYDTLKIHMKQLAIRDYTKLKLNFNCYKKQTLTHLSLVVMTLLDYILICYYKMQIWLRIIVLRLFSKHSRSISSKMDIFAWLSNIYRYKKYLWHVSYALRKTKCLKCIKQHKYIHGLPLVDRSDPWSTLRSA